jgi:GT2 family glycosyltransferase
MLGNIQAVVLSYNRRELLLQNLAALSQQTHAVGSILVLDNGSTDGTPEAVAQLANPLVIFHRLDANVGAARGFALSVQVAFENHGADWIWLMDDDMIPHPTALAELVEAYERNFSAPEQVGFLMSQAVDSRGRVINVPTVDARAPEEGQPPGWGRHLDQGIVAVRTAALVALLIPRSTYRDCGNLNPDFVIWGEDVDFTSRITETRPGLLVGRSKVSHLRARAGDLSIFSEQDDKRVPNYFYLYRNRLYIWRRFDGKQAYLSGIIRQALDVSKLAATGKWQKAGIALRGTIAGLTFKPKPPARLG